MPNKRQEARVSRYVARWKPRLLLDQWSVTIRYKEDSAGTLANILVDTRYTDTTLSVYNRFFDQTLEAQEITIIHELLHITTWQARDLLLLCATKKAVPEKRVHEAIEGLTEITAKILYKAYNKPARKPKAFHL